MSAPGRGSGTLSGACGDAGAVVVGWLVKVVVTLSLIAVVAFDAISVGTAHVSGTDDANNAAFAAADDWRNSHNASSALTAAQNSLNNVNETVLEKGFSISPDGTVHLLLQRRATTLVMFRIGPLKKYTVFTLKGESGPPA